MDKEQYLKRRAREFVNQYRDTIIHLYESEGLDELRLYLKSELHQVLIDDWFYHGDQTARDLYGLRNRLLLDPDIYNEEEKRLFREYKHDLYKEVIKDAKACIVEGKLVM